MTATLEPTELLAAEPAHLTNIRIGYARVSTGGQKLERQLDALTTAGCRRIFAEKQSGRDNDRPELTACLEFMHAGDTLVVPSLDRLSRSLQDLITTVGNLRQRSVGFTSLHESLDTTTPGGRLVFHVFAALAEFIREMHPRRPGRRPSPRPRRRTPHCCHAGNHPSRPRHAAQPRRQRHRHRPTPRSQPRHPLRPHPRPTRAARRRPRPPPTPGSPSTRWS